MDSSNLFPKRKSIRLKGYDYSLAGMYYVTICAQNREHFFGKIINEEMILNDAGLMILKWYNELENKFPLIECDEVTVMPNHIHFILINNGSNKHVESETLGEHKNSPLSKIIQWFKTMTINEYIKGVKEKNWPAFNKKLLQRNYWEHIIRSPESYHKISEYIKNNPKNWNNDSLFS